MRLFSTFIRTLSIGLIRSDYLLAIKQWSDSLPSESIIPCEWFLVNLTERCGRPTLLGGKKKSATSVPYSYGKISTGAVQCVKCKTRICTRCGGSSLLLYLDRVETRSRRHTNLNYTPSLVDVAPIVKINSTKTSL